MTNGSGNINIDALAYSSWSQDKGQAVTIVYAFMQTVPANATVDDAKGFQPMSAAQQQAARVAMDAWSAVANIVFVEGDAAAANILLGTNDQGDQSAGYAYLPEGAFPDAVALYLNNQASSSNKFSSGSYGMTVMLHELGHTLGLKHPGNYDSTGSDAIGPFLPANLDSVDYTLMSYNGPSGARYPASPQLLDIQAVQYLYGANMQTHTGDDVYHFSNTSVPQCVWDAGGRNTFDFSACLSSTVDLHAGALSSTRSQLNNVSIAYGVNVQAALLGSGDDTVICNDLGDTVSCGDGNDTVTAGKGGDSIDGGNGNDTVILAGNAASYTLRVEAHGWLAQGAVAEHLNGVETLVFADGKARLGSESADVFISSGASEAVYGGAGTDLVKFSGNRTDFQVQAAAGDFLVSWAGGKDTLDGIERLQFADGALGLDTAGVGGQTYRLYQAAFDRAPDQAGLGYWIAMRDKGASLSEVAANFIGSAEFGARYGSLDDHAFVTQLYQNILHRAPDQSGLDYWAQVLSEHRDTRANVLAGFSESNENVSLVATSIANGFAYTLYTG